MIMTNDQTNEEDREFFWKTFFTSKFSLAVEFCLILTFYVIMVLPLDTQKSF